MDNCTLKQSDINHLRRLLGWVRCEIGQTPEEFVETVRSISAALSDISDEGKARLVEHHQRAESVPKYVRAAVKALEKTIKHHDGQVVDAEFSDEKQLPSAPPPSLSVLPNP